MSLGDFPLWGLVAIGLLGAIQIGLQIYALLDLFKTPAERLLTEKRWVWVVVILLGLVGAVVYLAAAKQPPQVHDEVRTSDEVPAPDGQRAQKAADLLYGSSSDAGEEPDRDGRG